VQHDSNHAYISNNSGNMYIRQQTDDGDLVIMCDDGSGNNAAYITLDGSTGHLNLTPPNNVGIGTDSPAGALHVVAAGLSNSIRASNTTSDATTKYGTYLGSHYTNSEEPVAGMLITSGSASATGNSVIIGGGVSAANAANTVAFYTAPNKTTLTGTEKMRIDNSGNVGIGASSNINERLYVYHSSSADVLGVVGVGTAGSTNFANINFRNLYSSATGDSAIIGCDTGSTTDKGELVFSTSDGSMNATEKMRINSSGQVGIGTTHPASPLEVNGNVAFGDTATGIKGTIHSTDEYRINALDVDENGYNSLHLRADGTDGLFIQKDTNKVGIGTTSPQANLEIDSNTNGNTSILILENTGLANSGNLRVGIPAGNGSFASGATLNDIVLRNETSGGSIIIGAQDSVQIGVAGSDNDTRMLVNSSGNVGIGTTSPATKLHIQGSAVSGSSSDANSLLTLTNNANNSIQINSSTTANGQIRFGDADSNFRGAITYGHSDDSLQFAAGGTEAFRIDSQRNLKFSENGTNPSAAANTAFLFNDGGELKVLDELGNTTTISPHNFELIPDGASEDMAFAYHSTRHTPEGKLKKVNVDMMKLARLVEQLTGEKLVYIEEGEKDG